MSNSDIEQAGTVKGHIPNRASLSGRISNVVSLSGHISIGSGSGDFIIKMTLASGDDGSYTLASCDATIEQIDAAVTAEKRVVVIASADGISFELPMLQGAQGIMYAFGTFLNGQMMTSFVEKIDESTSKWQFLITQIQAESVDYSNAALPSVANVGGALDELIPKFHTHANKDTLDKLSVLNGKLQYNGSDVGLKGDKGADGKDGITPTIGANGNWYLDTTDTGKPSRGEKGDKGDTGAQGEPGKDGKDGAPGADGTSATHSWNGTVLTITSASGTSSADLKGEKGDKGDKGDTGAQGVQGIQGEKGDKGDKGDTGAAGADGYTPVRGTDYWTAADKAEIVNDTLAALPKWTGGSY